MNSNQPGQRFRGPPNEAPMRPGNDPRNGSYSNGPVPPSASTGGFSAATQMSRADKFEDEKKRIIESCFSKTEDDGTPSESYITHIRIQEDEDFPSVPAPREQSPQKKKPRVIIVAVRKSGRVRMHKGRENQNGTFSIGKSWHLDDLTRVESYSHSIPTNAEEQEFKLRAGDCGFLVTIGKPYYWASTTGKEKDFFIFSLIKIFRKYTGGKLPELVGFSQQEIDTLSAPLNAPGRPAARAQQPNGIPAPTQRAPSQGPPSQRAPRSESGRPDQRSGGPSEFSRERRARPSQERDIQNQPQPSPQFSPQFPPQPPQNRPLHSTIQQEHRVFHSAQSRERPLRPKASSDRMHLPGAFPSSESVNTQNTPPLRNRRSGSPSSQKQSYSTASGSRAPSENRQYPSNQYDSDHASVQPTPSGRSSSEQTRPNGLHPGQGRFRAPSSQSQRSDSADERPRTSGKNDIVPPALAIRSPKHRQLEASRDYSTTSEHSNYTTPMLQPSDSMQNEERDMSRQGRRSDRDYSAVQKTPFSDSRSASEMNPRRLPSQDAAPDPSPPTNSPPTLAPPNAAEPATTPSADFPPTPPPEPQSEPEVHRPGLGPMIKKKSNAEIASKFRKAAMAANAFKPRPGGAADKAKEEKSSSGDGITGVFQAPSFAKGLSQDDVRPSTPSIKADTRPSTPEVKQEIPTVNVTISPQRQAAPPPQDLDKLHETAAPKPETSPTPKKPPLPPQDERRKNRRSDHSAKYAKSLGINPSLVEGRTFDIEAVLNDFGWAEDNRKTNFEDLEMGIRKELARVEAGSWLGAIENGDDRTAAVGEMMDKVMSECEELDCLLTLYNVELGTLSEDVAYIEAQSQGLQVQTANQKLLHTELRNLLDTISISASQLKVLKDASLTKTRGIQEVESTLSQLYTAMLTIDPKLRQHDGRPMSSDQASLDRSSINGPGNSELSSMHAVREKRDGYRQESIDFVARLKQYMSVKFRECEAQTMDALDRSRDSKVANPTKLDDRLREGPKRDLWMYSPLMLFARQIAPSDWEDMMKLYESSAKKPYQDEFRDNMSAWKRMTRKPVGDEQEVLFTAQEKEADSLIGRKMTVKRTKTVRADGSSRVSGSDKPRDGKVTAYEAFAAALTEEARIIFIEQNFVVDLFSVSSTNRQDFVDAIATDPSSRQADDLLTKKPFDPDRNLARKVLSVMEEIFNFWSPEIQNLVDWAVKQDALNAVGVLFAMESQVSEIEDTNQEYLSQAITKVHDRLVIHFNRFIEEQIRGIEDTKVKIKKRKGIIAFMKAFPNFSTAVENMLPPTRSLDHLPIRGVVNEAYHSINKAMFESLKFIAKESPTATHHHQQANPIAGGDPEDKEALNHHILLIENMNHYIEEVAIRTNPALEEWNFRARAEMAEHLDSYISSIIRRPLGKLLDFLESTETALQTLVSTDASALPTAIAQRPSHSRGVFKKVLGAYDGKEIRKGIEALRKRVEKHFGEAEGRENPQLSRDLVGKVLKEGETRYIAVLERVARLTRDVYSSEEGGGGGGGSSGLEAGWTVEDVRSAFRR